MEDWKKAGRIAREALEYGRGLIRKNAKIIEVCDRIEEKIKELGGGIAFPAQVSVNQIAAHYCPPPGDDTILGDDVVCLDVGAEYNGAIGDNACTIDLSGGNHDLVRASEEALKAATEVLRVGVSLGEIGKTIQETINGMGFSPIKNLSGHGLGVYDIHCKPSIPNYDTKDNNVLIKGQTIAIEPFATDGKGMIQETNNATVFMIDKKKPVRNVITRKVLKKIESYKGLPFTTRWLTRDMPEFKVKFALRELQNLGVVQEFTPLTEVSGGIVSQAENSFLIDDEVITLTKL